jgi:methionine-rich copper-binding protein CopC
VVVLTTLLVFAEAAAVSPHALLLESTPSADTAVTPSSRLVLRFNGRLETRLSSVLLITRAHRNRTRELKRYLSANADPH